MYIFFINLNIFLSQIMFPFSSLLYMPSSSEINNLNNKIGQKIKYIEEIINSIEIYKRTSIKKLDRLKNHLKSEK